MAKPKESVRERLRKYHLEYKKTFLLAPIILSFMIFANADAIQCDEHITLYRASDGRTICVFESSVKPLVERGWAGLGAGWGDVCASKTAAYDDNPSCGLNKSSLDRCAIRVPLDSCLDYDIRPRTASECMEKYIHGYLELYNFPISSYSFIGPIQYSDLKCDLYENISVHVEDCQQWWSRYQQMNDITNATERFNELGFLTGYCLTDYEPEWHWWGCLDIGDNKDVYCGYLQHRMIDWNFEPFEGCVEDECVFNHHDGKVTAFQCEEYRFHEYIDYKFQLQKSPFTGKYECIHIDTYEQTKNAECGSAHKYDCMRQLDLTPAGAFPVGSWWTGEDYQKEFALDDHPLLIIVEKTDYGVGEDVKFRIVNSGDSKLRFQTASLSATIANQDWHPLYEFSRDTKITYLHPGQEMSFVWNQTNYWNQSVPPDQYRIFSGDYYLIAANVTISGQ